MRRTGEVTLGIIGMAFCALGLVLGFIFSFLDENKEFKMFIEEGLASDPSLQVSAEEVTMALAGLSFFGWLIVGAALIGLVFGLAAVLNIKGNKRPKLAGWMFIIGAVLTGIVSVGSGFLPALLYFIAGIMSFARKPPVEPEEPAQP